MVPLASVIQHRKESVQIEDLGEYKRCRVQLHAQGIVPRDTVLGAEIKTKKQQICNAGDFLVAEIDAKVGGFGIVPKELDGAIVSSHYFLFHINENLLDKRFLNFFIRTPAFLEQVTAQGSTNYAAIRPDHVLRYTIPLPPLHEQQQIVARIQALTAKIEKARGLQAEVIEGLEQVCRAMIFNKTFASSTMTPMRELVRLREPDIVVRSEEQYQFAGVYCFGRGVFKGRQKSGMDFAYARLTRLQAGNFVYPKLMAWEGALGVVPAECGGLVVSTEFPVFEINESRVFPEVLDVYFQTPSVWPALAGVSTGTNVRRRRLNPSDFLNYQMPLPSKSVQEKVRQAKSRIDKVKKVQGETAAELDALLPSILDKAFKGEL
jgi:type I restriction enzyme S subunit